MKVQIIYLDPHDDHVSARDKLGWAKAPRVLLVWPRRGRVLTRHLDLKLLHRWAKQNSKQIGLVTHDPDVLDHAKTLGIPVFESVERTPEEMWRRPARVIRSKPSKPERRTSPIGQESRPPSQAPISAHRAKYLRLLTSSLAIVAILILLAVLLPSANIRISPETSTSEIVTTFLLDPSVKDLEAEGIVPVRQVSVTVLDTLRQPTSGQLSVPLDPATGEVEFTNLTTDPIIIPRGTGLRTSLMPDLRFELQSSVELAEDKGTQARGSVRCTTPGTVGNLPINAIDSIEGTLGLMVSVTNPEPLSGGKNDQRDAVAASDVEELEQELKLKLLQQAAINFEKGLEIDEILLEESLHIVRILNQTVHPQVGELGASVGIELEVEVEAIIYHEDDLEFAVSRALEASLPRNVSSVPGTLLYRTELDASAYDESAFRMHIIARQNTYPLIDRKSLQLSLRSLPIDIATSLLDEQLVLESEPDITLSPSWIPRLPVLPMRISIQYPWGTS